MFEIIFIALFIILIVICVILKILEKVDTHRFEKFKNIEEVKNILETQTLYKTRRKAVVESCNDLKMQIDTLRDDLNYLPRNEKELIMETLDLLCAEYQSLLKAKEKLNLNISELDASLFKIYDDWRTKHGYKRQHYI